VDGWLGFYSISSMQITAIIYVTFISKASGICKRNYSFRMNIMEEIFDIKAV